MTNEIPQDAVTDITDELDSAVAPVAGMFVPVDVAEALDADARAEFDALSEGHRLEWLRYIGEARRAEMRARRIAKLAGAMTLRVEKSA